MRYVAVVLLVLLLAAGGYYYWQQSQTPQINGVAPFRAQAGEAMRLRGTRFGPDAQANVVVFGTRIARVTGVTPGEIQVEVPDMGVEPGAETRVPVRVRVGARESAPMDVSIFKERPPDAEAAPPSPVPTPEPAVADAAPPAPEKGAPTRRPARRPAPGQVTSLLSRAETALAGQDYEKAAGLYAEALKLDPQNPRAQAGRASALATAALRKSFVPGLTDVGSVKGVTADLEGFDTKEVDVKRAPESLGRIDFEVSPAKVKPGDPYTVKVFLTNGGKKPIRVKDVTVITVADGQRSSREAEGKTKEVASRQKALVDEISGVWGEVATWSLEVKVSSRTGDLYSSRITWK